MSGNQIRYAPGGLLGLVAGATVAQVPGTNPSGEGPAPGTTLPRISVRENEATDLSVSWRPKNNLRLTARLDNLFDDIYTTSSGTSQWRLAPPRTLSVWADVTLARNP
jgi:outer membrane receptor protein involved in Fe transport